MGLFDFGSKPPQPQGGLLAPAQPNQPNMRDKWLQYRQQVTEMGLPAGQKALNYDEWLKQQQQTPAPK